MLSARAVFALTLLLVMAPMKSRAGEDLDASPITRPQIAERVGGSVGVAFLTYGACATLSLLGLASRGAEAPAAVVAGTCAALLPPLTSTLVLNAVAAGEEDRWSIGAVFPLSTLVRLAFLGLGLLTLNGGLSSSHPDLWVAAMAMESLIAGGMTETALLSGRVTRGAERRNPFAIWATLGAVAPLAPTRTAAVGPALAFGAAWRLGGGRLFVGPQAQFSVPVAGGSFDSTDAAALGARFHLVSDRTQPSPFFGVSVGLGIGGRPCHGHLCHPGAGVMTGFETGLRFPLEGATAFLLRIAGDAQFDPSIIADNLLLPSLTAGLEL